MNDLIWVVQAKYVSEYVIELEFNNNTKGKVNFVDYLQNGIFAEIKELDKFKLFKLNSWTIEWENGADFSPEFLYQIAIQNKLVDC